MPLNRKQSAVLHVAKSRLKLSEEEYRSALVTLAGVTSSKELDQAGFEVLMGFFEHLGFVPLSRVGKDYGQRAGMASFAQLELIRAIWAEYASGSDETALNIWLRRTFKVDSLRFVDTQTAQKAITALKQMKARSR